MQELLKNNSGVSERLREHIAKLGLSQTKFAMLLNEPKHRVTDVLRGQIRLPADMLTKILSRGDVDGTWLLTGQRTMPGEFNDTEKILISHFRELLPGEQSVMLRAIQGLARAEAERTKLAGNKREGRAV